MKTNKRNVKKRENEGDEEARKGNIIGIINVQRRQRDDQPRLVISFWFFLYSLVFPWAWKSAAFQPGGDGGGGGSRGGSSGDYGGAAGVEFTRI